MDENLFWHMLSSSKSDSRKSFMDNLINELSNLSYDEIYDFEIILTKKMKELCTWDCFGALLAIEIVTDDGHFNDFRSWIISEGQDFFEEFKRSADATASKLYEKSELHGNLGLQSLQLATFLAMRVKVGSDNFIDLRDTAFSSGFTYGSTNELAVNIVYEAELPIRFSKIWALFQEQN